MRDAGAVGYVMDTEGRRAIAMALIGSESRPAEETNAEILAAASRIAEQRAMEARRSEQFQRAVQMPVPARHAFVYGEEGRGARDLDLTPALSLGVGANVGQFEKFRNAQLRFR